MTNIKLYEKVITLKDFLEVKGEHRKQAVERACELVDEVFRILERRVKP
jgi:hypothetical protein